MRYREATGAGPWPSNQLVLRAAIANQQAVNEGLVCVLQALESCWTFDVNSVQGVLKVQGERGKCSFLYHYYLHPQFGWMFVRLQTWFPFEIQVYVNGRDWLARQMDREGLRYRRSDNGGVDYDRHCEKEEDEIGPISSSSAGKSLAGWDSAGSLRGPPIFGAIAGHTGFTRQPFGFRVNRRLPKAC